MGRPSRYEISGNIVDPLRKRAYAGTLVIRDKRIEKIIETRNRYDTTIIPGFVDAHVHIESSMLVPSEFARLAVVHGTVATVSDPHEIANVLGVPGVEYMIENGKQVPLKFYFGASPCVPATRFETSGAELGPAQIESLLQRDDVRYLSEVMNYPAVIHGAPDTIARIAAAQRRGKRIDGHAPGVRGEDLRKYIAAGPSTDHEAHSREQGLERVRNGMTVIVREGSAARDFEALSFLIDAYPDACMLCSDDKHPDDLVRGHIDALVRRALAQGYDEMNVLRCASVNPVRHYGLDVGLLQPGDFADFLVVDGLRDLRVLQTYIDGELVAERGASRIEPAAAGTPNNFRATATAPEDFRVPARGTRINVIVARDGMLITGAMVADANVQGGHVLPDVDNDILKIAVLNRYEPGKRPAVAFVKNFGLKKGAIASAFAHDSHNVVAVGVTDRDLSRAVNLVVANRGGISLAADDRQLSLALPVAGLMSNRDGYAVAAEYASIDRAAKELGSRLSAPYTTLSFMALLVIPELKLSDRGLFDAKAFAFTDLFAVPR